MKTKEEIQFLQAEIRREVEDKYTTEERRNNLQGALDVIDHILR